MESLNPELWRAQDHVDYWVGLPFYQLDLWESKDTFAGVFTASRVTHAAFSSADIPAHIMCVQGLMSRF